MTTPDAWPARLGPTAFYREQQSTAAARTAEISKGLQVTLADAYGPGALQRVRPEAALMAAAHLRRHFKQDELLLFKADLISDALTQLTEQGPQAVAALPPPPPDTTFGFEYPATCQVPPLTHDARACKRSRGPCKHVRSFMLSVVVPCALEEMFPGADTQGAAFAGFARLTDMVGAHRVNAAHRDALLRAADLMEQQRQAGVLWQPVVFHPLREPLGEGVPVEHLLKMALHLGSQPDDPEPEGAEAAPRRAGAGGGSAPAVRTVYLRRRSGKGGQGAATGTGKPLQYQSMTKGHMRYYRNEDGSVRHQVWIEGYTRGEDKPPRPPEAQHPKVKVARKAKHPPEGK